jgi:hypothetical protein
MREPKMSGPNQQVVVLSLTLLAMQEALRRAALKMCETQGAPAVSRWLSELEDELIRSIKDTVTEGASMADEVRVMDGTVTYIRFALGNIREQIGKSKD